MKQQAAISQHIQSNIRESVPETAKKISFSQLSVYMQCPYRWYLTYARKLHPFGSTIDTVFGTAFHETLQKYLELLFNQSVKEAEAFKMYRFLHERFVAIYQEEYAKNEEKDFATVEQLEEYYNDGIQILDYIKKNRRKLFDTKKYELAGIEIPLLTPIIVGNEVFFFNGFIDVVLREIETGKIIVYDIKTSRQGWRDYQKKDAKKIAQVLLYKRFFSQQFGIPEEDIDVLFFIVKRKLYEQADFPQSRVQQFTPANGKIKVNEATKMLHEFLHDVYDFDGNLVEKTYFKRPGEKDRNCTYCPFKDNEELCNRKHTTS